MLNIQVHKSALKRNLSADEVVRMWRHGIGEIVIDDDEPPRKSIITKMQRGLK